MGTRYVPPDPGSLGGDYYETIYTEEELKPLLAAIDRLWSKVAHRIKTRRQGSFEIDRRDLLDLHTQRERFGGTK